MTTSTSLIEMILNLLRDPSALASFEEDPEAYLASCGASEITSADVYDAVVLHREEEDAHREHGSGSAPVHVPPPVHPHEPEHGESEHEAAVKYLNTYITNNHIDDRDTIVDNSVNQQIDTGGGDFDQEIDVDSTVVSGDGAIGAGGDIEDSTLVTGDENQVGDGNVEGVGNVVGDDNEAVTGAGNTAAFGDGAASSLEVDGDLLLSDGAALANGGDAFVDNSDNSLENVDNDYSDNSLENVDNDLSDNSDNSDSSLTDVDNDTSDNSDNSDNSTSDSGNLTFS